jgi:hypothetical protein
MSLRRTLAAATAAGALAVAVPAANAATPPRLANPLAPNPNFCLKGFSGLGAFGSSGPYGDSGPWGPNGPMHGQPNPIGDAANCGGLMAYVLRGGTLSSFVQANLIPNPVGG